MKKFLLSLLLPLFILLGLQEACGQTGPLYHPDEKAPIHVEDDEYE